MTVEPGTTFGTEGTPVRIAIGLIRRGDQFLARPRPPGSVMAGFWEFPGGKVEPGETPEDAAARECREELGIAVRLHGLRRTLEHHYPHGDLRLFYFDGEPDPPDAEPDPCSGFVWACASELSALPFLEANAPVLASLAQEFPPPA